jgi:thiol-disulfide isomerase/thioredoxin
LKGAGFRGCGVPRPQNGAGAGADPGYFRRIFQEGTAAMTAMTAMTATTATTTMVPCFARPSPAAALALLIAALPASAFAAQPTVDYALGLAPFQKNIDVDYDRVSPEQAKACTIKMEKEGGLNAWVVRGPRGEVLRSFADTNGDRVVDRWSYYRDGAEVYRDIDSNHNTKADQARWLGAGGSRWGVDEDENGLVDAWKAISAEEATAEIVEALKSRESSMFTRLLPSNADLQAAGFEEPLLSDLSARVTAAAKGFARLAAASQNTLGPRTTWTNMLASRPGSLPAGTVGVGRDVMAYDNVVALVEGGEGKSGGTGQVFVGSLVRIGDAWRPVDLPQLPGMQAEIADAGGFFGPRVGDRASGADGGQESEKLKPLLAKLREVETKLSSADPAGRKALAGEQVVLLEKVVAAAEPAEKPFWFKQLAETIAAGVQDGSLPEGIQGLERLAATVAADDGLAAFVRFRLASARYAAGMQQPNADIAKVQAAWLDDLKQFVEQYPQAPDAAEAMLQMGISDEFLGDEKKALERYDAIVKGFPESPSARKARGAARRLESVGKPLALSGVGSDGRPVSLESLRGRPVLVHYWATWCEPCKVDIAQIRELHAKYGPREFAVVGIALDTDKNALAKFLAAKPIPWAQLHESGGLDGPLAEELGVLTLPTMFLLDAKGNVVDRNLVISDLEKKLEGLIGAK